MAIESEACEEDSKNKLMAYVEMALNSKEINSTLLTCAKVHTTGSFPPKLKFLFFRHCVHLRMGCIDHNCFTESENSALLRDISGLKPNCKLHVAADATINHVKNR